MKSDKIAPIQLAADAERGEVLLTLNGQPMLIRFGLKFLKSLTDLDGSAGPSELLDRLQRAPLSTLLELAEHGIRQSKQAASLPAGFDVVEALDELPRAEQKELFSVLLKSVSANPLMEVLTQGNPS
ncbi:hypothetical protein GCM10027594_31340 [Hymenobacter agri]